MADLTAKIRVTLIDEVSPSLRGIDRNLSKMPGLFSRWKGAANIGDALRAPGAAFKSFSGVASRALGDTNIKLGQTQAKIAAFDRMPAFSRATAGVTRFQRASSTALGSTGRDVEQLKTKFGSLGDKIRGLSNLTIAVGGLKSLMGTVTGIAAKPVRLAGDYDESQAILASKLDLDRKGDAMKRLGAQSMSEGLRSKFSPSQVSAAQIDYASTGMSPEAVEKATPSNTNFAIAGRMDPMKASAITTTATSQYSLGADKIPAIHDSIIAGADKSKAEPEDFGAGLNEVGTSAATLSQRFQRTVGYLSLVADGGRGGSRGGTALDAMYQKLIAPSEEARKMMKSAYGWDDKKTGELQQRVATGDIDNVLREFAQADAKLPEGKAAEARSHVFEQQGGVAANIIFKAMREVDPKTGRSKFDQRMLDTDEGSRGANEKQALKMSDHLNAAMDQASGAVEGVSTKIGLLFVPELKKLSEWVGTAADSLSKLTDTNTGGVKAGAAVGVTAAAAGSGWLGLKGMTAGAGWLRGLLGGGKAAATVATSGTAATATTAAATTGVVSKVAGLASRALGPIGAALLLFDLEARRQKYAAELAAGKQGPDKGAQPEEQAKSTVPESDGTSTAPAAREVRPIGSKPPEGTAPPSPKVALPTFDMMAAAGIGKAKAPLAGVAAAGATVGVVPTVVGSIPTTEARGKGGQRGGEYDDPAEDAAYYRAMGRYRDSMSADYVVARYNDGSRDERREDGTVERVHGPAVPKAHKRKTEPEAPYAVGTAPKATRPRSLLERRTREADDLDRAVPSNPYADETGDEHRPLRRHQRDTQPAAPVDTTPDAADPTWYPGKPSKNPDDKTLKVAVELVKATREQLRVTKDEARASERRHREWREEMGKRGRRSGGPQTGGVLDTF